MRGVKPAEEARRLVDEAEFELDCIREFVAHSKSLDRTGAPKPPPLPLMPLSPPVSAASPAPADEVRETLAGRLAMVDAG